MTGLTGFRVNAQRVAGEALGLEVLPGRLAGPSENRDIACCFPLLVRAIANADEQELQLGFRVFLRLPTGAPGGVPADPTPLEALVDDLQAAIVGNAAELGVWVADVAQVTVDLITWGIDAIIIGRERKTGSS